MSIKRYLLNKLEKTSAVLGFGKIAHHLLVLKKIEIEKYIDERLKDKRYDDPKKLNRYEFQAFSQNGEDGIIKEIFTRIGLTNRYFVEFGVGNGTENNTAYLMLEGWSGAWIEGSPTFCADIKKGYAELILQSKLQIKESFITKDNINDLFSELKVPISPDLLSIDIDGNDYWIWKELAKYRPRVVVIEYNASVGAYAEWVMPYNAEHCWNGTQIGHYFGASLKSFENLGRELGYSLVGCNLTGANAFFVRNDLVQNFFAVPFTSEFHYEKPMYFLEKQLGHKRGYDLLNSIK